MKKYEYIKKRKRMRNLKTNKYEYIYKQKKYEYI